MSALSIRLFETTVSKRLLWPLPLSISRAARLEQRTLVILEVIDGLGTLSTEQRNIRSKEVSISYGPFPRPRNMK